MSRQRSSPGALREHVTSMRDPVLEAEARRHYSAALPYHNFEHALAAVGHGERLVARCREAGIDVDATVVYLALLFHDAGYEHDERALGFSSKEAYAADIASRALSSRGFDPETIERVAAAILSTEHGARFECVEQKVVRAADLAGLAADYDTFRANAEALRTELRLLQGEDVPWPEWVRRVDARLGFYLGQDIHLTDHYFGPDGRSAFHTALAANLARLRAEAGIG